jgi:CMP-N,N'-diacetyllegionaminic acid synthase
MPCRRESGARTCEGGKPVTRPLPGPVWAIVPARGGSKSIPLKNLVSLAGRPLLDYGVLSALASNVCDRIIGSTDDHQIATRFRDLGIEVDMRPSHLATDESSVADTVSDLVRRQSTQHGLPWLVVLVQPTSPFVTPAHISGLVDSMAADPSARSGQTIAACPHNHHAWNQREFHDGHVSFVHQVEREQAYNKQAKPKRWVFGNLLATTAAAILSGDSLFARPSAAVIIEPPYDFDLDSALDLRLAEAMIASGLVDLAHL